MESRSGFVFGGLFTIGGIVAAVRLGLGHFSGFWDALGVAWLVILPFALNVALGKIIVDEHGILSWRPLWRKAYRWQDISEVTVEKKTGRGNGAFRIRVYRHGGRPIWLPAPYVDIRASDKWQKEFTDQAEDIKARWREATGDGPGKEGTAR
ncbi:hypothetical protein [Streptomyces sp. CBMA152]|uniref:hypothetical protein n=1 Tax=Streptomyces sp. CBMA152 TaxID=1896312 RepID=UPI001660C9DC|nr:hypothetical protein [Streptomyces sp. CBMA152]MBD0741440.1 hypothetical protein [Streptomyces sp. CBMA152]